jgi:uncharacterized protein YndB with AHSA1/START domain
MLIVIIVIVIIALAILALLGSAAAQPNDFSIQRSALIDAPPSKIYPFIENFHQWTAWSPFEKLDPAMERTYNGPDAGVGARYGWAGKGQAGTGSMEIVEAAAPSRMVISLVFTKPFEAHNRAAFTLAPEGAATRVTWIMSGERPFMHKLMGLVFSMDKMVGGSFEQGLADLKAAAEAP